MNTSEADRPAEPRRSTTTLGDLLAEFAERVGFDEDLLSGPIASQGSPLGADLLPDEDG